MAKVREGSPVTSERVVLYSTFSPDFVARCVERHYPVAAPEVCELYHRGLNDTYRIRSQGGEYAFRVYRCDWRSRADVDAELAVLRVVGLRGVDVAEPIARIDGDRVTMLQAPEGERCSVLFTWAAGHEPQYRNEQHAESYGRTAGLLHNAGDAAAAAAALTEVPRQIDASYLLEQPLARLRPLLEPYPSSSRYFEELAQRLAETLVRECRQVLDWGLCHGDLHCGNARIDDERRLTLFDFDCCGMGWRAFDLATFRWAARLRGQEPAAWSAFVRGYRDVRPVPSLDLELIPTFMLLRCFWLLGIEAARASIAGRAFISADYFRHTEAFCRSIEAEAPHALDES
jgi:Ser/Thr protein kinase RdoA (MazF antagonist)